MAATFDWSVDPTLGCDLCHSDKTDYLFALKALKRAKLTERALESFRFPNLFKGW